MARICYDYHKICEVLGIDYFSTGKQKKDLKDTEFAKCYNNWLPYNGAPSCADVRMTLCCVGRIDWRNLRIAVWETREPEKAILFRGEQVHLANAMKWLLARYTDAVAVTDCMKFNPDKTAFYEYY